MSNPAAGYSLTESVVAIFIMGMVASAIGSTVLSVGKEQVVSDRRQQAAFYSDLLRQTLRGYVISDGGGTVPSAADLAELDLSMRGFLGCAANCQKIPGDACNWALAAGCKHDASALLPAEFRADPIKGNMTYEVTTVGDGRSVKIDVDWVEPET